MRRARVKVEGNAYYHITSRCALQSYLLENDDEVKTMFLKMLRRAEDFSGVKIVNYCIMDNHFHILLNVPKREEIDDIELERRLRVLYGAKKAEKIKARWNTLLHDNLEDAVEKEKTAYKKRMYDISEFMKTFKQRFTLWYCTNRNNIEGTIWQGPFHSVLVEGEHDALGAISTYITLNPVRAKMVEDASQYKWCGYGAACAGDEKAKKALLSIYSNKANLKDKMSAYKEMLDTAMAEKPLKTAKLENEKSLQTKTLHATMERNPKVARGVAFGSINFVKNAIAKSTRPGTTSCTYPRAYCKGENNRQLYCAGRKQVTA